MATWKKIVVSGSSISALNNDANFLVEGQSGAELTGSFTGSFTGDGSGLTGVVASNANPLTQGNAITAFSYDGSTSGITVGVDASGLVGNGLGHTGGNTLRVVAEDTTISVGASGIKVVEANLSGIPNSALTNDSVTLGSTEVDLGTTAATIAGLTLTGAVVTGSFSGSFIGTTNLPDLTSGNGLTGGPYDGAAAATFAVQADGSTLAVGAGGVKVADAGITATQIATSVAGAGLSGGAGTALAVNVDDSSIEIATDTLRVKAAGVTNTMLANDSVTIGSTEIDLGATAASLAGLTTVSATSFTGSFNGDGSDLTGIASTLALTGSSGTGTVALKTQALSILAGEGIDTVASGQSITISGEDATTTNKGIASFNSGDFAVSTGAVSLASDITIDNDLTVTRDMLVSRNAVISGNLTVAGTASFQNTQNLDVADRFIRMASGSTAVGDGGIVVQQTGPANGEAFAYDAATTRWSMTGSFDPSTEAYTPDAFVSAIVEGGVGVNTPAAVVAKYNKKGNIFVGANEDIYIYS
jgi:fibronectin-binding autotransporter adhesin